MVLYGRKGGVVVVLTWVTIPRSMYEQTSRLDPWEFHLLGTGQTISERHALHTTGQDIGTGCPPEWSLSERFNLTY